jgi:protoporphyrinogen oxidase
VLEVAEAGDGVTVRWQDQDGEHVDTADAAVLACTGKQVTAIYPGLDATRRAYLDGLKYSTCIMVQLGVRPAPDERASMVLLPRDLEPDLPIVALSHNIGPNRAPDGTGTITTYWMSEWSRAHLDDSDEALVAIAREKLGKHFPGWADTVETSLVTRWEQALVASRVGTYAGLVDFQRATDPRARIQLAGDYQAQASVNAAVAAGERAAERLAALLTP